MKNKVTAMFLVLVFLPIGASAMPVPAAQRAELNVVSDLFQENSEGVVIVEK